MRNSCKFAWAWHAKLPTFAGKNTCSLQTKHLENAHKFTQNFKQKYLQFQVKYPQTKAKTPAIAVKNTRNHGQKHPQLHTKASEVAGKHTRICKHFAVTPRVKAQN